MDLHGVKDGLTEKKVLDIMSLRKMYVNTANLEKTCRSCEKTFPRNTEYFYAQKHHSQKNHLNYSTYCIACENKRTAKYKKRYKGKIKEIDLVYRKSEHGYFMVMWNSVKKSKHGNEFESFEEFFNCWKEQQKTYGTKCPYLNVEMTRNIGNNESVHNAKKCNTNISRDRIDSSLPYSSKNTMFCSWQANNMKGSVTPMIAKRYLGFYRERFGNE